MPTNACRGAFWLLLEYPRSSRFALLLGIISVLVVLLSVTVVCLETIPDIDLATNPNWQRVETACISWFVCEYISMLIICPCKVYMIK